MRRDEVIAVLGRKGCCKVKTALESKYSKAVFLYAIGMQ